MNQNLENTFSTAFILVLALLYFFKLKKYLNLYELKKDLNLISSRTCKQIFLRKKYESKRYEQLQFRIIGCLLKPSINTDFQILIFFDGD